MKLIDLLVKELPKRGGWPEGAVECQRFVDEATIDFYDENGNWDDDCSLTYGSIAVELVRKQTYPCESEQVTRKQYESALAASQKPAWNGEGLPPVGEKVEFFINPKLGYRNAWNPDAGTEMEVVAHKTTTDGNNVAVCYWDERGAGRSHCFVPESLKPPRSEAERKRHEAAESIDFYMPEFITDTPNEFYHAKKIYDAIAAGKIPGVKLED
ncbi:TPA: hypothetical protein KML26_004178 [Escherichia coli]|nr:hypothetical protein [Escherichia coli]